MRYIIETETPDLVKQFTEGRTDVSLIDQYDPIEKLTGKVEKMRIAFEEFKKSPGSWRIMNYYLRGRGVSQSEIDNVLGSVEEFLKQIR